MGLRSGGVCTHGSCLRFGLSWLRNAGPERGQAVSVEVAEDAAADLASASRADRRTLAGLIRGTAPIHRPGVD